MHTCAICNTANPKFALSLKRENGKWAVKPVCGTCRYNLSKEARAQKKFIPFYGLEASLKEVEKRNAELGKYKLFVDAFAKANVKTNRPAMLHAPPKAGDRPLKISQGSRLCPRLSQIKWGAPGKQSPSSKGAIQLNRRSFTALKAISDL